MLAQIKVEHAVERILLGHHAAAHMRQLHRAPVCAVGLEANAAEVDALINQQTVAGHRYAGAIRPTIETEDFA